MCLLDQLTGKSNVLIFQLLHFLFILLCSCFVCQKNMVASGGLGGEVFIWDIEAALSPVRKSNDTVPEDEAVPNGNLGAPMSSLRVVSSSNNITGSNNHGNPNGYSPITAKGHKDSVYALAMNDAGTILVSGGTEKV
jgi:WD repeat-containing protein 48